MINKNEVGFNNVSEVGDVDQKQRWTTSGRLFVSGGKWERDQWTIEQLGIGGSLFPPVTNHSGRI